ncbi:MAG: hydroxyacid dehydrogenase [Candidatus Kariarchaeaceae archaeon]|jgi:D-3-phosphoglycerate dehydrogenase
MKSSINKKRILISDPLDPSAATELKKEFDIVEKHYSPEELVQEISKFHAVIVRSATKITSEIINKGTQLEVIGRAGIGVDNINVKAALKKGIRVVNAPGSSSVSVAELTMAFMLALCSKLVDVSIKTKSKDYPKPKTLRTELQDKTLGCIGCGKIGKEVILRANIFRMKCLVYSPSTPSELSDDLDLEKTDDLDHLLRVSDYITIHTKLKPSTHNLISKRELELMKPTAYLINCARGGIVDEEALYNALKEGKIAGAALDVYSEEPVRDNKLFELDNIYASPHIGASTKEAQERVGKIIVNQVRKALQGLQPDFIVTDSYFAG